MATGTMAHAQTDLQRARYASAANVVAGLWLIAAPFVLNFVSRWYGLQILTTASG